MNATTNYSNRVVDIELLQTVENPTGERQVSISISQPIARIVTGVQKSIQRYAAIFLSVQDSKFDSALGTDFMKQMWGGTLTTRERISSAFAFANADVMEIMQKDDSASTYVDTQPDDEKISQVDLLDYQIDYAKAQLMLRLLITTAAGTSMEFVLPTTAPRT